MIIQSYISILVFFYKYTSRFSGLSITVLCLRSFPISMQDAAAIFLTWDSIDECNTIYLTTPALETEQDYLKITNKQNKTKEAQTLVGVSVPLLS